MILNCMSTLGFVYRMILTENHATKWPFWRSPVLVMIVSVGPHLRNQLHCTDFAVEDFSVASSITPLQGECENIVHIRFHIHFHLSVDYTIFKQLEKQLVRNNFRKMS
uniref:Uncharacterized protein n=1 Tax=Glossina austeni TaxID=7395 RepID=A0A1A9V2K5_GLOAU